MPLDRQQIARAVAIGAAIVVIGSLPWTRLTLAFSAAYSTVVDALLLEHTTFGKGAHARLSALDELTNRPADNLTADAKLSLTVENYEGDITLQISTRRDAYLPLLIVAAIALAAPGAARTRALRLALGLGVVLAYNIAALHVSVLWMFAVQMRGVYELSPFARSLVDLVHRTLLLPPGNRFIVPLAVGAALAFWRSAGSAAVSPR